jgi:hypothetical protein
VGGASGGAVGALARDAALGGLGRRLRPKGIA